MAVNSAIRCHAEVKVAISKTFKEPERTSAVLKKCSLSKADTAATLGGSALQTLVVIGIRDTTVPDAVKKARSLAIRLNGETVIFERSSHCLDIGVADQAAARFIRFIPDGQLGKPTSEIAFMGGR